MTGLSAETLSAPNVVVLDETLDLNAASELARTFAGLRGAPVTIDPSHVGRVGAQCVQVLIAARKTWMADGTYFTVTPGSEPFNEGLDLLGLTSFFSNERA
ncbi:STAS domain-containing protein [Lichenihabitans sp. Uapishka_5]|uniref:STAS domain-containing protein n=1 Tax=Lichenihabitans sp. Uapishka_5 TaxID=3037302 RepID=UPI0029E812D1|nr:STAS domain-containing protein [Lichenihabitans sp. Uapishka_5]MDX7951094.1 STAS domain-containing protein [Lichenihabitans sp. Uapishka_5]